MQYGYARVSTDDQNPALQLMALQQVGGETLCKDTRRSGATAKRPAHTRCLRTLTPGKTLMGGTLDRLGRSRRDRSTMLDDFHAQASTWRSLTAHIDTKTAAGRAMWQRIGVLVTRAQRRIPERPRAGVQAA